MEQEADIGGSSLPRELCFEEEDEEEDDEEDEDEEVDEVEDKLQNSQYYPSTASWTRKERLSERVGLCRFFNSFLDFDFDVELELLELKLAELKLLELEFFNFFLEFDFDLSWSLSC